MIGGTRVAGLEGRDLATDGGHRQLMIPGTTKAWKAMAPARACRWDRTGFSSMSLYRPKDNRTRRDLFTFGITALCCGLWVVGD